jgi:hypothetical protein
MSEVTPAGPWAINFSVVSEPGLEEVLGALKSGMRLSARLLRITAQGEAVVRILNLSEPKETACLSGRLLVLKLSRQMVLPQMMELVVKEAAGQLVLQLVGAAEAQEVRQESTPSRESGPLGQMGRAEPGAESEARAAQRMVVADQSAEALFARALKQLRLPINSDTLSQVQRLAAQAQHADARVCVSAAALLTRAGVVNSPRLVRGLARLLDEKQGLSRALSATLRALQQLSEVSQRQNVPAGEIARQAAAELVVPTKIDQAGQQLSSLLSVPQYDSELLIRKLVTEIIDGDQQLKRIDLALVVVERLLYQGSSLPSGHPGAINAIVEQLMQLLRTPPGQIEQVEVSRQLESELIRILKQATASELQKIKERLLLEERELIRRHGLLIKVRELVPALREFPDTLAALKLANLTMHLSGENVLLLQLVLPPEQFRSAWLRVRFSEREGREGQEVAVLSGFDLRLEMSRLGLVIASVVVRNRDRLVVRFKVESGRIKKLFRRHLHELRSSLAEVGYSCEVTVGLMAVGEADRLLWWFEEGVDLEA